MPNTNAIGATEATQLLNNQDLDILQILKRLLALNQSAATVDQQKRQRITVDNIAAGVTLGTITTVSAVSNIGTVSGMDHHQFAMQSRLQFANCIRSKLN